MRTAPHVCRSSWWEIVRVFLTLGALSPSGPGLTGILQTEVQEKRGWLSQARFVDGMALVNMLPGPSGAQLSLFLGYIRAGWWGGLLAGLCFLLPSFVVMLTLTLNGNPRDVPVGKAACLLNGKPVPPKTWVPLKVNDVLYLAKCCNLFFTMGPASLPAVEGLDVSFPFGEADANGMVGESPASWHLRWQILLAPKPFAHVFLHGLVGGLGLARDAHAEHHLGCDREQQEPSRDAESRQRDAELTQQPVAEERRAGEKRGRDDRGADRDASARLLRQSVGDRQEGRHQPDRVDDHGERHQR